MPRYRVIKEIPEVIPFRDGTVHFEDFYAGGKDWVWYCRREIVPHRSVDLCTADGADRLAQMRAQGFTVKKDSTADHVLRTLARKGYVERMAE